MDPVTAFQVAASVIAFVDFSRNLVSDASRVYHSPNGRTQRTVQAAAVGGHLREMRGRIEAVFEQYQPSTPDDIILKLCRQCDEIGVALQHTVDDLTATGTTKLDYLRSSFVVAARGLWRKGQLVALNEQLDQIRSQMMMTIMVSLWRDNKTQGRPDEDIKAKLNSIERSLDKTVRSLVNEVAELRGHTKDKAGSPKGKEDRELLVKDIWESEWEPNTRDKRLSSAPPNTYNSRGLDSRIEGAILESLSFTSMDDRGSMVPGAYGKTFDWIFRPDGTGNTDSDEKSFVSWLESEDSKIYWITGKAGSGKSTLMKYITGHPSLQHHLAKWAGSLAPLWTSYYFWDAGSNPLQKSRAGMMRTLLHHCLRKRPSLMPIVAPRRWALYSILGNTYFTAPAWTTEELNETLALVAAESGNRFRLAMFIDGLDEFDGSCADLIGFIKELNSRYNVKICVASRPWTAFADALVQSPSIMMQEVTMNDIRAYIEGHFENSRAFHERRAIAQQATTKFISDIAMKAEGVFLWVSIVVRILAQRLRDGQSMSELQVILEELPNDMLDLYTSIWNRIEPSKIETASRFFQLKIASVDIIRLDVKLMWITDGEVLPPGDDSRVLQSLRPVLKRRLDTHTRGILEISPSGYIEFLHRSAKDWLMGPQIWDLIRSKTPDYDPSLALLDAANTHMLPSLNTKNLQSWGLIVQLLTAAANVPDTPANTPKLIASLDRMNNVLAHGDDNPTKYSVTHWSTNKYRDDIRRRYKKPRIENSFVGLAAQFAILPYVRAKVEQHPQLLQRRLRHLQMSLLENAIYGWEGDATAANDTDIYTRAFQTHVDQVPNEYKKERWFVTEQRIDTIRFLLAAGESPKRQAHMHEAAYITVSARVAIWGNKTLAEKQVARLRYGTPEYWDDVAGVFRKAPVPAGSVMVRWKQLWRS